MIVDEQAHQFGHAYGRVGVVELDGVFEVEMVQRFFALEVDANEVAQGARDEEVLLLQAQLLADGRLVVRVKNLGDGFRGDLFPDGTVIVARVERLEIEGVVRLGFPEAEHIDGADSIALNQCVARSADHDAVRHPPHPIAAIRVGVRFGASTEFDIECDFGPG